MLSGLPLVFALFKTKQIVYSEYKHFFIIMCLAAISEIIVPWLLRIYATDNLTALYLANNINTLLALLLWLCFFKKTKLIPNNKLIFLFIISTLILMASRIITLKSVNTIFFYGSLFSYIVIIFYSVELLSRQSSNYLIKLFKDSKFLIACGNVLFFTFQAFILILFYISGIDEIIKEQIINIFYIASLLSYILYTYAVICI